MRRRARIGLTLVCLVACESGGAPVESAGADEAGPGDSGGDGMQTGDSDAGADGGADSDGGTTGSDADPCEVGGPTGVELGHGLTSFVPLADEAAELVYGAQGGFHIVIGLRARGLDDSDIAVARLRGLIDGMELGSSAPYAALECAPDGTAQEALGLLLIWDVTPDMLHDRMATVEVELTDTAGTVVTATAQTMIFDPNQG